MKIYVNCRFLSQKITGVQRFAIEICRRLKLMYNNNFVFVAPYNISNTQIAKDLDVICIGKNKGHIWEQIDLPIYLYKKGCPPLLNLCNSAPIFYNQKFITQHDINYVRYPESFSFAFRLLYNKMVKYNTKHCIHIFTVSKHSKDELGLIYNINDKNITVIYNSVDNKFVHIYDENLASQNYVLAASSSPTPNKNFEATINAFFILQKKMPQIKLYIFGDCKSHKVSGKTMNVEHLKKHPNIRFLNRVDDKTLIKIYSNAKVFIYPSRYEGFGIPPLEAQACGCPVVSSLLSSLPEVLCDSAILCDPNDYEMLAESMESLIVNSELRETFIKKGYENLKKYSWDTSTRLMAKNIFEKTQKKN